MPSTIVPVATSQRTPQPNPAEVVFQVGLPYVSYAPYYSTGGSSLASGSSSLVLPVPTAAAALPSAQTVQVFTAVPYPPMTNAPGNVQYWTTGYPGTPAAYAGGQQLLTDYSSYSYGVVAEPIPAQYCNEPFLSPVAAVSGSQQQPANPLLNSTNMGVFWHGYFDHFFSVYPLHSWKLFPTPEKPPEQEKYHQFTDSAKVRFLCTACGNAWTSMKGRVAFWFRFFPGTKCGVVLFKLFGQQCQKCHPGTYEHSMWYPEEVGKVLLNICNRVGQIVYGMNAQPVYLKRRAGRPRTQHNSVLCQACADNVCTEANRPAADTNPAAAAAQ